MELATVGKWAFIVGLVLAVVAGILFEAEEWVFWVLAILGVVVGLLNIAGVNTQGFLLAAIALTLSATALNTIPVVGETLSNILEYVAAFVAGAMIVVALKALFETARPSE
jgi:ATP synthase protein I